MENNEDKVIGSVSWNELDSVDYEAFCSEPDPSDIGNGNIIQASWNLCRVYVIPLIFLIVIKIYLEKSKSSKKRKIIIILITLILVVALYFGGNYLVEMYLQ